MNKSKNCLSDVQCAFVSGGLPLGVSIWSVPIPAGGTTLPPAASRRSGHEFCHFTSPHLTQPKSLHILVIAYNAAQRSSTRDFDRHMTQSVREVSYSSCMHVSRGALGKAHTYDGVDMVSNIWSCRRDLFLE